jgi:hypothetical protein
VIHVTATRPQAPKAIGTSEIPPEVEALLADNHVFTEHPKVPEAEPSLVNTQDIRVMITEAVQNGTTVKYQEYQEYQADKHKDFIFWGSISGILSFGALVFLVRLRRGWEQDK